MKYLQRILRILFGTKAGTLYILLFAAAIGIATFIENDFGTSAAQKVVFQARWFELLLFLLGGAVLSNIIWYRMIPLKKWSLFTFHFAIIIILIGAGITRYFGFEGIMHIREGESANHFLSSESYIQFEARTATNNYAFDKQILISSLGENVFDEELLIENKLVTLQLEEVIPNPKEEIVANEHAGGIVKIVVAGGSGGRIEHYLKEGEVQRIGGEIFNFSNQPISNSHWFKRQNDSLFFMPAKTLSTLVMATQSKDTIRPSDGFMPIKLRALHTDGQSSFVFSEWHPHAEVSYVSEGKKIKNESLVGLTVKATVDGQSQTAFLLGNKGIEGQPQVLHFADMDVKLAYGSINKTVPFQIKLERFEMERYPGTNSAASYASDVVLMDPAEGREFDYRIFMNNILTYKGYRFFQSSFDRDEKGTYLSVNHDFWGTWVSYLGYALLTLGFIMTLFSKKSYFYKLGKSIQKLRNGAPIIIAIFSLFVATEASAQEVLKPEVEVVQENHADRFSQLIVQDFRGRMKPLHTLDREVLRKVYGRETFDGFTADQVILSMLVNRQDWYDVPLVKVGEFSKDLVKYNGKHAAYADFFDENGEYLLSEAVSEVHETLPADRDSRDKDLLKVDERLNILGMVFSGRIFKMIPVEGDQTNTWVSAHAHGNGAPNEIAQRFFSAYINAVHSSMHSGNYAEPNQLLAELDAFQKTTGAAVVPSPSKRKVEIFLNNLNVFGKLALYYLFLGLLYVFLLFFHVFQSKISISRFVKVAFVLVLAGFIFHTLGLGMRWYVSGRAPWSNGYESMIYIAWTSTLAGLLFTRKNMGGMAATMVLASTTLLIAWLSYLDPEITPLVPVLKSYWLTIHVSMVAGSYGFLLLGAIMGLLNLILMVFTTAKNKNKLRKNILEMTYISEMTLTGGLFMLSVGTYLGGVWANESWGRYWGWDAKETWALVTILVYAFILHMRLIPGLKNLFTYNLATLFGLSSVIMTYFGVNYYLSGLHSYAAGDPIPVPGWVYGLAISFAVISLLAARKRKWMERGQS